MLRFILLGITRRPVLTPPTPQREYDISSLPTEILDGTHPSTLTSTPQLLVTALPPHAPLRSHLYPLAGALPESHLPHPLTLVPELDSTSAWTAEILTSTATLLHMILLIRATVRLHLSNVPKPTCQREQRKQGPEHRPRSLPTISRSLPPFLLSLAFQLLARHLRPSPSSSLLLSSHYAQLDRRLATHFFLTGPMWIGWTRPKVMGFVKGLERIPIVGLVGELVEGYLPLVDDYFYCERGSYDWNRLTTGQTPHHERPSQSAGQGAKRGVDDGDDQCILCYPLTFSS